MNNTLIMSSIHLTVKENVVISPVSITQPDQGEREIDIRPIDMEDQEQVIKEIERLVQVRMMWNIHTPPKPEHIKYEDYGFENRKEYQEAKDKHYKDYKTNCLLVDGNIKMLSGVNTTLCMAAKKAEDEIKIKNGTFYNPDELEHIDELEKLKKDRRKQVTKKASAKYYDKNKEEILTKRKIKIAKDALKEISEKKTGEQKVLVRGGKIIKPLCLCGRQCDLIKFQSLRKHSNIEKHLLFKSIIALVHYNRRNKKILTVVNKINNDLCDYKKVVREMRNGKSVTITNKTEKEIIELYGDYLNPIDESKTHQPRKSYIKKKEYTKSYKDAVNCIRFRLNKKLFPNLNKK